MKTIDLYIIESIYYHRKEVIVVRGNTVGVTGVGMKTVKRVTRLSVHRERVNRMERVLWEIHVDRKCRLPIVDAVWEAKRDAEAVGSLAEKHPEAGQELRERRDYARRLVAAVEAAGGIC